MFTKYRKAKLTSKLVALVLLLGLVAAYNITTTPQLTLSSVLIATGLFISLHILIQYPRFVKISLIGVLQIGLLSVVSLTYSSIFSGSIENLDGALALITSSATLLAVSAVIAYLTMTRTKGSKAFTLAAAFALLDITGILIGLLTNWSYIPLLILSTILALGFVFYRSLDLRHRKALKGLGGEVRKEVSNTYQIETKINSVLTKNKWDAVKVSEVENFWVINTGKNIIITTGLVLDSKVQKTKTGFAYNSIPLENVFADLSEQAATISQTYKLPRNKTHFAVIDVKNNGLLPVNGYQRYELAPRKEKTNIQTRLVFATSHGINMFVKDAKSEGISEVWANFIKRFDKKNTVLVTSS